MIKAVLVCAAAAALAAPSFAQELIARQGDDSVRLSEAACSSEQVLRRLDPSAVGEYKSASAVFQGQRFTACWRIMGNVAHLVYEDGDQGIIPVQELKPDLTA